MILLPAYALFPGTDLAVWDIDTDISKLTFVRHGLTTATLPCTKVLHIRTWWFCLPTLCALHTWIFPGRISAWDWGHACRFFCCGWHLTTLSYPEAEKAGQVTGFKTDSWTAHFTHTHTHTWHLGVLTFILPAILGSVMVDGFWWDWLIFCLHGTCHAEQCVPLPTCLSLYSPLPSFSSLLVSLWFKTYHASLPCCIVPPQGGEHLLHAWRSFLPLLCWAPLHCLLLPCLLVRFLRTLNF